MSDSLALPRVRSAAGDVVLVAVALAVALGLTAVALLANASLLAMTACAQPAPQRFVLKGGHIEICDLAGAVRLVPGSGADAEVLVTRGGRDAARLRIETGNRAGRTTLHVIYPGSRIVYPQGHRSSRTTLRVGSDGCLARHGESLFTGHRVTVTSSGAGLQAWADIEVRLPRGQAAALYLGVGEVAANGVEGDLRLDVAAASVRAERTRGPLLVDTGSGDTDLRDCEGDISVDTGSGHVSLAGVRGTRLRVDTGSGSVTGSGVATGALSVDTGSGHIELDAVGADDIVFDTGSGGVRLGLERAPRSLAVDTGSGAVTITGPAGLGAAIELETGSGAISCDYPLTLAHRGHDYLAGTIGDGKGRIKVDTGSGSVLLKKR
jgi:hypothetical protein